MSAKAKIAISLAAEVLTLLDRHAAGRSRSRCIEEELLRALRAREWERLSAQLHASEAACEQIVRVPKRNFLADEPGVVRPMGGRLDEGLLDDIVAAVVAVISA